MAFLAEVKFYENGCCSASLHPIYNCHSISQETERKNDRGMYSSVTGIEKLSSTNPALPSVWWYVKDDVRKANDLHIFHPSLGEWIWSESQSLYSKGEMYWIKAGEEDYEWRKPVPKVIIELKNQAESHSYVFSRVSQCKYFSGEILMPCAVHPVYEGCSGCKDFEI